MKPQFDNQVMSSFLLWFENKLLKKGEGYTNVTTEFFDSTEKWNFGAGYNSYSAPYKQHVYDLSVTGANVMTGVSVTDSVSGAQTYNLKTPNVFAINPMEGVVTLKTDEFAGEIQAVTGDYAVKEVSIKFANNPEEKILFETKYRIKPLVDQNIVTGMAEDEEAFPIIYLKNNGSINEPGAFGGQEFTSIDIRAIVLADSQFQLDAINSIFRDTKNDNFMLFDEDEYPMNYIGSYEGDEPFNYSNTISGVNLGGPKGIFIDEVSVSRINDSVVNEYQEINASIFAGIIDFQLMKLRTPDPC